VIALLLAAPATLPGHGHDARRLATVWWQMFGMGIAVYLVVGGLILWAMFRHRDLDERRERAVITIGGVAIPAVILAVLSLITISAARDIRTPTNTPLRVSVIGHKWWWEIRYPGTGAVTANEMHIPVGRTVRVSLRTADVIHSFWVPELGGKTDLEPDQTNTATLNADRAGTYTGECAEYCGLQHANMRFRVVAESPSDFGRWLTALEAADATPEGELVARGQAAFIANSCAGCHTIKGTEARGRRGPDLTLFGAHRTIGALTLTNTPAHLKQWIVNAPSLKPGVLMPPLDISAADRDAIVAYLESMR
jgi:cytochrome c oxidase subunit 2